MTEVMGIWRQSAGTLRTLSAPGTGSLLRCSWLLCCRLASSKVGQMPRMLLTLDGQAHPHYLLLPPLQPPTSREPAHSNSSDHVPSRRRRSGARSTLRARANPPAGPTTSRVARDRTGPPPGHRRRRQPSVTCAATTTHTSDRTTADRITNGGSVPTRISRFQSWPKGTFPALPADRAATEARPRVQGYRDPLRDAVAARPRPGRGGAREG
jgi:hypothetical protein